MKKKQRAKPKIRMVRLFSLIPHSVKLQAHQKAMKEGLSLKEAVSLGLQLFIKRKVA